MEQLQLSGLTMLQAQELRHQLLVGGVDTTHVDVHSESVEQKGHRHGLEPLTLIAITLGPQVLVVLGGWLLKSKLTAKVRVNFSQIKPDGTKVRLEIEQVGSSQEAASAELLRAIRAAGGGASLVPDSAS